MKARSAAIRVFCGQDENEGEIVNGLKSLVPLDFEKERIYSKGHKKLSR